MSSVTGLATLCMAWTSQVYFVVTGFNELQITPLWVLLNLTVAVISANAVSVVSRIGAKRAIIVIMIAMPLGYILLGALPLLPALASLYLFYMIRGYATPMLRDLTNQHCRSEIRATVLSLRSLLVRISFSIIGPLIGFVTAKSSLSAALIVFGVILSGGLFITGTTLLRVHQIGNSSVTGDPSS